MNKNLLILHIAIFLLSFPALFAKGLNISAGLLSWWRCLIGAAVAFFIIILKKKLRVSKKQFKWLTITGFFMGLHWWTYFASIQYSTVAIGILALFTHPIITVILEPLFFKTKYSLKQIIGGVGIIGGVFFLIPEFNIENNTTIGVLIGVLSALFFCLRNILTRKYLTELPAITTMGYHILFAFLILSVPLLFSVEQFTLPTRSEFSLIFILGTVFTIGSHGLMVYSFKNFTVSTAGILGSLQVLYGAILAWLIFIEIPTANFYLGAVIILGIAIYEMKPVRKI